MTTTTVGRELRLRDNTPMEDWDLQFVFVGGGMGDFINYTGATVWLAKHSPWVKATLWAPKYLCKLLEVIHQPFKHWKIDDWSRFPQRVIKGARIIGPDLKIDGMRAYPQLVNALGAHPFDLGFAYYAGSFPPPTGAQLPQLDLHTDLLPKALKGKRYIAIPVGANKGTSRLVTGKHLNPVIDYIVSLGILPVFIGKADFVTPGKYAITFADDLDYHKGLDLRDKTDLLQAAAIMQHSVCTVGLDCGQLHLAAITKDSKIIFAYNITSVAHREPRRTWGKTINITLTDDELVCIGCQSKIKQIKTHTFDQCLYEKEDDTVGKSPKCIDMLFAKDGERFKRAIDEMIDYANLKDISHEQRA